ncbi:MULTISPECIES: hypothetical protein [Saccharothrix]|nr:hypothetical protein [Saccharothrix sp. CB00851]
METGRLVLDELGGSDVDDVARLLGEPRVMRYIEGAEHGDVEYELVL